MANIEEGYLYGASSFFRVSSDLKVLKNEEYELVSVDGKSIGIKYKKEQDGRFNFNSNMYDEHYIEGNAYELYPTFLIEQINSMQTVEDVMNTYGSDNYFHVSNSTNYKQIYMSFYIPLLAKQTKVEPGYKKQDIIINARASVYFLYNENNEIQSIAPNIELWSFDGGYIYDGKEHQINSINDLKQLHFTSFNEVDGAACMNTNAGMIITDGNCTIRESIGSSSYRIVPYFIAEKGTVTLKIENTVNGLAKYNASKDKNLEYKINVQNTGDVASTQNKIVTYVPSGVTVIADSISDSGVYNESNDTITWTLENLEAGETAGFSYKATAPAGAEGKELIGHSTVESGQVLNAVYSNNTVVTMDKIVEVINNPETGTMVYIAHTNIGLPLSYIMMFLVALCVVILFLARKLKKTH